MEYHRFTCNDPSTVIAVFVCHLCHSVVRPQDFIRHLDIEVHRPNSANSRFSVILRHRSLISEHILKSHGVIEGISLPPFPVVMDRPIPGLEVYPGFVCAESDCVWGCSRIRKGRRGPSYDASKKHYQKKHTGITFDPASLISCLIMTPYRKVDTKDPDFTIVIRLPLDWIPSTLPDNPGLQSSLRPVAPGVAPTARFLEELGWLSKLKTLKVSVDAVCLVVSSPRLQQLSRLSGDEARLYRALLVLYKLLCGYLLDGSRFTFSRGPEVTTALTAG